MVLNRCHNQLLLLQGLDFPAKCFMLLRRPCLAATGTCLGQPGEQRGQQSIALRFLHTEQRGTKRLNQLNDR